MTRSFVFFATLLVLFARIAREGRPLDDADETVSSEVFSCSSCVIGDMTSAAASSPFFVVVPDVDREPRVKSPFAFGADATRRMKRDALAPSTRGDSGPERDADGGVVGTKDICEGLAVCGILELFGGLCLSPFASSRSFSTPS